MGTLTRFPDHEEHQLNCDRLVRKFNGWEKHQQIYYMPAAISARKDKPHDMTSKKANEACKIPLWFPSQFARLKTDVHIIDHRLLKWNGN